jgi:Protein of unknown function (DUF4199)
MKERIFNWRVLIMIGLTAGISQAVTGIAMYLAGIYFLSWSVFISILVLIVGIVFGSRWYRDKFLGGRISYAQALLVGIVISVSTGAVYAIYNIISISFFYPHFLDEIIRLQIAHAQAAGLGPGKISDLTASLTATVTAPKLALGNLIRLSVIGSVLSLITSLFVRKKGEQVNSRPLVMESIIN